MRIAFIFAEMMVEDRALVSTPRSEKAPAWDCLRRCPVGNGTEKFENAWPRYRLWRKPLSELLNRGLRSGMLAYLAPVRINEDICVNNDPR